MRTLLPILLSIWVAGHASAEQSDALRLMTPDAFRAYSEGWTLHFEENGVPFGSESYFDDGEVLWKPAGGPCARGEWVASGDSVCFVYASLISCWRLWMTPDGVEAEPMSSDGPNLSIARRDRSALNCAEVPAV